MAGNSQLSYTFWCCCKTICVNVRYPDMITMSIKSTSITCSAVLIILKLWYSKKIINVLWKEETICKESTRLRSAK